jgi:hypothetical protein
MIIAIPKHEPADLTVPIATFECQPPWWEQRCRLRRSRDPAPEVGAFLVARGRSAILQIAMQPDRSLNYRDPTLFPSLLLEPGLPREARAREIQPGVFERRWSKMLVRFSCANYSASFLPPATAERDSSAGNSYAPSRSRAPEGQPDGQYEQRMAQPTHDPAAAGRPSFKTDDDSPPPPAPAPPDTHTPQRAARAGIRRFAPGAAACGQVQLLVLEGAHAQHC